MSALTLYQELAQTMRSKKVHPLYLFYGVEEWYVERAKELLRQYLLGGMDHNLLAFNHVVVDARVVSVTRIIQEMETPPFFAEAKLVVVTNAPFFSNKRGSRAEDEDEAEGEEEAEPKSAWEDFVPVFKNPTPGVVTVFETGSANLRLSLSALLKKHGAVYNFTSAKRSEAVQDAQFLLREGLKQRGLTVVPAAAQKLLNLIGIDEKTPFVRKLHQELDKLAAYKGYTGTVSPADIALLVSRSAEAKVFDITDALSQRNSNKALYSVQQLWQDGEEPFLVLSVLAKHFRQLLLAKEMLESGISPSEAAAKLGVHPFVAGKIVASAQVFTLPELKLHLHSCFEIDHKAKTGQGEPMLAIEMLLVQACSGGK